MGRLIDADKYMNRLQAEVNIEADIIAKYIKEDVPIGTVKDCGRIGRLQGIQWCKNVLELDCYTVEAIPKAEYGARLKADLVAMLTDIQLEIEETVKEEELIDKKWANGLHYSEKIIQQKIDALKESENG